MLNRNDRRRELHAGDPRCRVGSLKTVHRISKAVRRTKDMILEYLHGLRVQQFRGSRVISCC